MGIHERFDADRIQRLVLEPMLKEVKALSFPRHRLLWAGHNAPGPLKPDATSQSYDNVVRFNRQISQRVHEGVGGCLSSTCSTRLTG